MRLLFHDLDKQLGDRDRRKVQNNTYLNRRGEDAIAVTLHATDVLTANSNGTVVLNSGGWHTMTTKDRINGWLPAGWVLFQKDGDWIVRGPYGSVEFEDGMVIDER